MTDAPDDADDLLHQLGAVEREYDERFPHAWEDAVRGQRSVDEVAAQRREAGDDPDEIEALAQVLGPLGEAERDAWVDRLAALTATSGEGEDEGEGGAGGSEGAAEGAEVVSLASRRRTTTWVTTSVGLLAAAALAFWMMPRDPVAPVDGGVSLPSFGLVVRNETVQDVRSGDPQPGAVPRYRADTGVHWVIRPERAAPGALSLRVLAEPAAGGGGAERRLLDPGSVTISDQGVIEVRGRFGELMPLPVGRWSLRLVVGATPPADVTAFDRGGDWSVVEPAYVVDVIP